MSNNDIREYVVTLSIDPAEEDEIARKIALPLALPESVIHRYTKHEFWDEDRTVRTIARGLVVDISKTQIDPYETRVERLE